MSSPTSLSAVRAEALAKRDRGDVAGACALLEHALEAATMTSGEDHPEVLRTGHLLATMHRQGGDLPAARRVLENAIYAGGNKHGDDYPPLLAMSFDLAQIADELGNRHEARRHFTRVARYGPAAGFDEQRIRAAQAWLGPAAPPSSVPMLGEPVTLPGPTPVSAPTPAPVAEPTPTPIVAAERRPVPAAENSPVLAAGTAPPISGGSAALTEPTVVNPALTQAPAQGPLATETTLPSAAPVEIRSAPAQPRPGEPHPGQPRVADPPPARQPPALTTPHPPAAGQQTPSAGWQATPSAPAVQATPRNTPPASYQQNPPLPQPSASPPIPAVTRRGRWPVLAASAAAVVAVLAAVVTLALALVPDRDEPLAPDQTVSPQELLPATDLELAEHESVLVLRWKDPSKGVAAQLLVGNRIGEADKVLGQPDNGETRFELRGLNSTWNYCFRIVTVYSPEEVRKSDQVCTNRPVKASSGS